MNLKVNQYSISRFYKSRLDNLQFDDNLNEDEWQLEIYLHALGIIIKNDFNSILDIGCGSGFKLITYLGEYKTVGLEIGENVEKLRTRYPDHEWNLSDFSSATKYSTDVAICSDVIEHLLDPDELIEFLLKVDFKYLILSTPARDLMHKRWNPKYYGPPVNQAHVREWTQGELARYISSSFTIIDQRVTNLAQCTQMVICTK